MTDVTERSDHEALAGRVDRLEALLADLAEHVGTGGASHVKKPEDNVALKIAAALRPATEPSVAAESVSVEACGYRRKGIEDQACVLPKGHSAGHTFANVEPASA